MPSKKTLSEVQKDIDRIYGEGVWTIKEYNGGNHPCLLSHKCGESKVLSHARNISSGKLLCSCDPVPATLQEVYDRKRIKKDDLQKDINRLYGEGVWTITEFSNMRSPLHLIHECGEPKVLSRAMTVRAGTCTCSCEPEKRGRGKKRGNRSL